MDNQHQKIRGYRDLNPGEIDLMNAIKVEAERVGALIDKMDALPNPAKEGAERAEIEIDKRWLSIARTGLQQSFMALTRAVARPNSF